MIGGILGVGLAGIAEADLAGMPPLRFLRKQTSD